jgi:hypothetical protein
MFLKIKLAELTQEFSSLFFLFFIVFIVNSKGSWGHCHILNLLNIIKKTASMCQERTNMHHVDALALLGWRVRGCPTIKPCLSGRRLKVLDTPDSIRRCLSQNSWWFGFNDLFIFSSLNLDFRASPLKIQ